MVMGIADTTLSLLFFYFDGLEEMLLFEICEV